MKPVRVCVIGLGGVGSYFVEGLVKTLQFQLPLSAVILIDGDSFEEKNLARQSFRSQGNKAVSLQTDLSPVYNKVFILAEPAWIVSQDVADNYVAEEEDDNTIKRITAESIINEGDYVFVLVDNFAARKLVFEAGKKYKNIDIFTGGNGSIETDDPLYGSIYHYCRRDDVDITLSPLVMHTELADPSDRNPGEMSCSERAELAGGTQIIAVNMAVASFLLYKLAHCLLGSEEEKTRAIERAEMFFDLAEGKALPYDRRPTPIVIHQSV